MHRILSSLFFLLSLSIPLFSQTTFTGKYPIEWLRRVESPEAIPSPESIAAAMPVGNLVVGYPNPNEVREINTPMSIVGDIIVLNNGTLRFNNVDVALQGNIFVLHSGKFEMNSGALSVAAYFAYQRSLLLVNKGSALFRNSSVNFGGFNVNCAVSDTALLQLEGTNITGGVMTTVAARQGTVNAKGVQGAGEYLFFDKARGSFENVNFLLTWFVTPAGSTLDFSLPQKSIAGMYVFPDSAKSASGIGYRVQYTSCTNTLWGLMTHTGSTVRVSNSELLACGAMFQGTGAAGVSSLVNEASYTSLQYPATDRDVRFTDTKVRVWNFYPGDRTNVTIQNCIFGEILTQNRAQATVLNSFCDGTGGYVGSMDSSRLMLIQSQILPEVNARHQSQLFLVLCNVPNAALHTAENGLLLLINSSFSSLPTVESGSGALIGSIDEPSSGFAGQKLKVYGSARLIAGATLPVHLSATWLDFRPATDPDLWRSITQPRPGERYRDTLATWDTKQLSPGEYVLRLNIKINMDANVSDTIRVERVVRLLQAPVRVTSMSAPQSFSLLNYPNPIDRSTTFSFNVPPSEASSLRDQRCLLTIHDLLGRTVATVIDGAIEPGMHSIPFDASTLRRGMYSARVTIGAKAESRMMIVK